ncbi:MAG: HAD family hydrolase [Patescibacteria group bacterium]
MNKAFIFDWSGTLSDNFRCFVKVCALMFKKYGLSPISENEIKLNFDTPYMKFWNKYLPDQTQVEHHRIYEKLIHQVDEPRLYPGVENIVRYLNGADYKIFVLSSDPVSKLMIEVLKSGLEGLFSKIIGGVHDKKETLTSLIKEFKLNKDNTFYVGDTAGDVVAGKYAGLKTVGISWGFQHKSILTKSKPDFLIDDIIDIKKIAVKSIADK